MFDNDGENGYLPLEVDMLKYWGNIFGMLGVALVATAFFRDPWMPGTLLGAYFIICGAWLHGLSLGANGGKQ